jgi:hypothetical protein
VLAAAILLVILNGKLSILSPLSPTKASAAPAQGRAGRKNLGRAQRGDWRGALFDA